MLFSKYLHIYNFSHYNPCILLVERLKNACFKQNIVISMFVLTKVYVMYFVQKLKGLFNLLGLNESHYKQAHYKWILLYLFYF